MAQRHGVSMPEFNKSAKPKSRRLFGLVAFPVAALLFLGGTVATQAFTPDVADQVDHFVECFGWMIVDPAMHEAECGPGIVWPHDPVSEIGGGGGIKTTTTTTTTGGNEDGNDGGGDII
jgi:hypothetical protein